MTNRLRKAAIAVLALASVFNLAVAARADDEKGESAAAKKLKGRSIAPAASDIDPAATLEALIAKNDAAAFSQTRGATIKGWVVQAELEQDGDVHMTLAAAKGETDTRKWMIVEVTPAWQKTSASLSAAALRKLVGTQVQVTGWLFWEPDDDQQDPRGTKWEIHPVTAVEPAK